MKYTKPKPPLHSAINSAAIQDHLLREFGFSKPKAKPHSQPKFQNAAQHILNEVDVKQAQYKAKLTLAQRLGLIEAPPPPLTNEEWDHIEKRSIKREINIQYLTNQNHQILSCSHIFHKQCIEGFERLAKIKMCPVCRRRDYEKKTFSHAQSQYRLLMSIRIQRRWRGFITRKKFYENLVKDQYQASSKLLRRRILGYKLSMISSKMQRNMEQRQKIVQNNVDSLDDNMHQRGEQMQAQMIQIQQIKENNLQEFHEIMNNQPKKILSLQEWHQIRDKALARKEHDCAICQQTLMSNKAVMVLSCSHMFHGACLSAFERYSLNKIQCPMCRCCNYEKMQIKLK